MRGMSLNRKKTKPWARLKDTSLAKKDMKEFGKFFFKYNKKV